MSTPIQPAVEPEGVGYRPGACNIGAAEIRKRRLAGAVGIAAGVALGAALVAAGVPAILRLAVLFPLWGGAIGLLQAHRRFCVAFAMAGVANFGSGEATRVAGGEAARRADRAATVRLLRDAFVPAVIATVVFAVLPV